MACLPRDIRSPVSARPTAVAERRACGERSTGDTWVVLINGARHAGRALWSSWLGLRAPPSGTSLTEPSLVAPLRRIRPGFVDLPTRVALLGTSLSGGICAYYAAQHPDELVTFVLLNPLLNYKKRLSMTSRTGTTSSSATGKRSLAGSPMTSTGW